MPSDSALADLVAALARYDRLVADGRCPDCEAVLRHEGEEHRCPGEPVAIVSLGARQPTLYARRPHRTGDLIMRDVKRRSR